VPYRRLPLYQCQSMDGTAREKDMEEDGKAGTAHSKAGAGVDQRRGRPSLPAGHGAHGTDQEKRHSRGNRR